MFQKHRIIPCYVKVRGGSESEQVSKGMENPKDNNFEQLCACAGG